MLEAPHESELLHRVYVHLASSTSSSTDDLSMTTCDVRVGLRAAAGHVSTLSEVKRQRQQQGGCSRINCRAGSSIAAGRGFQLPLHRLAAFVRQAGLLPRLLRQYITQLQHQGEDVKVHGHLATLPVMPALLCRPLATGWSGSASVSCSSSSGASSKARLMDTRPPVVAHADTPGSLGATTPGTRLQQLQPGHSRPGGHAVNHIGKPSAHTDSDRDSTCVVASSSVVSSDGLLQLHPRLTQLSTLEVTPVTTAETAASCSTCGSSSSSGSKAKLHYKLRVEVGEGSISPVCSSTPSTTGVLRRSASPSQAAVGAGQHRCTFAAPETPTARASKGTARRFVLFRTHMHSPSACAALSGMRRAKYLRPAASCALPVLHTPLGRHHLAC